MESLLVINRVAVSNANAICGLTFGFPSPTTFLGFVHALERKLELPAHSFRGAGIICHHHQVLAHNTGRGQKVLSLTRNPVTKEGGTAPFAEEGRMHMTVSLVVETSLNPYDLGDEQASTQDSIRQFEDRALSQLMRLRIAGGRIDNCAKVSFISFTDDEAGDDAKIRSVKKSLMPGFCLIDRSAELPAHHSRQLEINPGQELLDSWLDFSIRYRAPRSISTDLDNSADDSAEWVRGVRPVPVGWVVPIQTGYKAISALHEPGVVDSARDTTVPCVFVEGVYGLGEWKSPHRIKRLEDILWRYHAEGDWYLCKQGPA